MSSAGGRWEPSQPLVSTRDGQAPGATLQAVETDEGTVYVLRRPGHEPISAYWPHPLLELEPNAVRLATHDPWSSSNTTPVPTTPARGVIVYTPLPAEYVALPEIYIRAPTPAFTSSGLDLEEDARPWEHDFDLEPNNNRLFPRRKRLR